MIFKHFFRPKYQDPNPQVRIQAIANLTPDESQHKSQLHELAFNDEDPNVNLAALTRLNSFALWCKTAETAKSEKVKKRAQSMVENALFEQGDLKITPQERRRFITECKNNSLLEKLLQLPSLQSGDTNLFLSVLEKLNKPHVTKQQFVTAHNEHLQLSLLSIIEDQATLNKALKRTPFDAVKDAISAKLNEMANAKLRPIEVEKNAKLVLSQLLALKDKTDYALIKEQYSDLNAAFTALQEEFCCLKAESKSQLNARFDEINVKVKNLIEVLAPQFEAAEQRHALVGKLNDISDNVSTIVAAANLELSLDVEKVTLGAVEDYEHSLQECQARLSELKELLENEKPLQKQWETISSQIIQCRTTLERLPEFKKAVSLGKEFIENFSRLKAPNDVSQIKASQEYLSEQTQYWKALSSPYGSGWPDELEKQWQSSRKGFTQGLKALQADVKANENRCKAKLRAIDNLISQGKYNAAMGLYEKVISWYEQLPERNKEVVNRQLESVKEQVENLKDLQQYIAQPRKPAVLKEAEVIALNPMAIDNQVAEVKRLRSAWNSLGNTGTEADNLLNTAFDMAIEKAFEPCRLHFAEMESQRKNNELEKLALIEQLKALQSQETPINKVVDDVLQIQKRWKLVGKVDYKILDKINEAYSAALNPLKARISQFYQDNADAKQVLITKAQKLQESEDINEAIEQAKRLQVEWKEIGQAGRKLENGLWKTFREANDQLFAKRNEMQNSSKQTLQIETQKAELELQEIQKQVASANSLSAIEQATQELQQFSQTVDAKETVHRSIGNKVTQIEKQLTTKKKSLKSDKKRKLLDSAFVLLDGSIEDDEENNILESLPQNWKQAYLNKKVPAYSRSEIAVLLDILASQESPNEDLSLRKNLQLQMMTDKLQHGEQIEKDSLLLQFIQHGKIESSPSSDGPRLLERVKSHFIT